jgi:hypothetical protein
MYSPTSPTYSPTSPVYSSQNPYAPGSQGTSDKKKKRKRDDTK